MKVKFKTGDKLTGQDSFVLMGKSRQKTATPQIYCQVSWASLLGARSEQQDVVFHTSAKSGAPLIVGVLDGMGGMQSGKDFAQLSARFLTQEFKRLRFPKIPTSLDPQHASLKIKNQILGDLLVRASQHLHEKLRWKNGGSTLCCVLLHSKPRIHHKKGTVIPGIVSIVNAGDSRVYSVKPAEEEESTSLTVTQLSFDHQDVYGYITQCLTTDSTTVEDFHVTTGLVYPSESFYLCSDGFYHEAERISDLVAHDQDATFVQLEEAKLSALDSCLLLDDALAQIPFDACFRDNATLAILRFVQEPDKT